MREIEHLMSDENADLDALLAEYDRLQTRYEAAGGYDVEHPPTSVLTGSASARTVRPTGQLLSGGQRRASRSPSAALRHRPAAARRATTTSTCRADMAGDLPRHLDRRLPDRLHDATSSTASRPARWISRSPAGGLPAHTRYLDLREDAANAGARNTRSSRNTRPDGRVHPQVLQRPALPRGPRPAEEADRLERIPPPQGARTPRIRIAPRSQRPHVLSTTEMAIGNRDADTGETTKLLTTPELEIERGDRIGLLGPNGSGKTTLLKSLMGQILALRGDYTLGTNVHPGYYAQSHEQLRGRGDGSPLSVILDTQPMSEEAARTYSAASCSAATTFYSGPHSLGASARLALAVLCWNEQRLVLDEPTNHLDLNAREPWRHADRFDAPSTSSRTTATSWTGRDEAVVVHDGGIDVDSATTRHHRPPRPRAHRAEPEPEPEPIPPRRAGISGRGDQAKGKPRASRPRRREALAKVERRSPNGGQGPRVSRRFAIASADQTSTRGRLGRSTSGAGGARRGYQRGRRSPRSGNSSQPGRRVTPCDTSPEATVLCPGSIEFNFDPRHQRCYPVGPGPPCPGLSRSPTSDSHCQHRAHSDGRRGTAGAMAGESPCSSGPLTESTDRGVVVVRVSRLEVNEGAMCGWVLCRPAVHIDATDRRMGPAGPCRPGFLDFAPAPRARNDIHSWMSILPSAPPPRPRNRTRGYRVGVEVGHRKMATSTSPPTEGGPPGQRWTHPPRCAVRPRGTATSPPASPPSSPPPSSRRHRHRRRPRLPRSRRPRPAAARDPRRHFVGHIVATDGTLDRAALGAIVFSDPAKLASSTRSPPDVIAEIRPPVAAIAEGVVVLDAVKLVESGHADNVIPFGCNYDTEDS